MRPKIRGIGTVALGIISGANAIYQLLFRHDIALFIVNAIVVGAVFFIGMVATIAFILIMNHFFGFEQWESWQKSVVRVTFVFCLATVGNRYFKK